MKTVTERLLSYIAFDTQSIEEAECVPSTDKQFALAYYLADELRQMGANDVTVSEHCYVMATIPATTQKETKVLGFIAHMDTATSMSGVNVKPRIIYDYRGDDIILNQQLDIVMRISDFPALRGNIGKDLIVTDGTTLLGADDKAGIAEIMTMTEYLLSHPEIEHGKIRIAFTPDEEVGRGVDFFDVNEFGADFAYTVDGGLLGEIEYENFNAASARITLNGKSIHPGSAKGKMLNALLLGMEVQHMLPVFENPMYTEGYEGFYHLDRFEGDVEKATMYYIIRDHDKEKFEKKKEMISFVIDFMNKKYGENTAVMDLKDSYYNMKEMIEPHMHLIEDAKKVMKNLGIEPIVVPIRGGTDGARLSYMGLPCPNLCTGGDNFHGKYEYIPIQSMEMVVQILLGLVRNGVEK